MSSLTIKLKNLTGSVLAIKNNLVVIFYLAFLVLAVFEFFVVQDAVQLVFNSQKEQAPNHVSQKVRINFADYDANLKRLQTGQTFDPDISIEQNPFKSK